MESGDYQGIVNRLDAAEKGVKDLLETHEAVVAFKDIQIGVRDGRISDLEEQLAKASADLSRLQVEASALRAERDSSWESHRAKSDEETKKAYQERDDIRRLYRLLLAALGVTGHYGAMAEINALRRRVGFDINQEAQWERVPEEFNDISEQVAYLASKRMGIEPELLGIKGRSPSSIENQLSALINRNSGESVSNTPDYILADFLLEVLASFNKATNRRTKWYTLP